MNHIKDRANPNVDRVLIYAGDHGYYWRKGGCGYTTANDAGVFTRAEAYALAGHCGPEKLVELHDVPEDHLPTLKEQIGMIREYNETLRRERDYLRADYRQLEKVRQDCLRRCERMKSLEGMSLDEIAARQLEREDTLRAEVARLREALKTIDGEVSTISEAKQEEIRNDFSSGECHGWWSAYEHIGPITLAALSSTPTAAEWLAARDEEMKRFGAAEWLEKEAADNHERLGTHFYESTTDSMLAEAARLRAGKGE